MISPPSDEATPLLVWLRLSRLAGDLSIKGTLSRLGAVKRALSSSKTEELREGSRFLIDHNEKKLEPAQKIWGDLTFVNLYEVAPSALERLLLLGGQLLSDRQRRVVQGMATALSLKRVLPENRQVYVWNPTQIVHHCIIEIIGSADCMIFNPIIPLPANTMKYSGRRLVREVYKLPHSRFREVAPRFNTVSKTPRIAIYLSKLPDLGPIRNSAEARLVEFGVYLWGLGIETRFFFHYRDRQSIERAVELGIPREICDLGDSMNLLSSAQISLSANSTIGLDLNAAGCAHFFCIVTERPGTFARSDKLTPLANYLLESRRHLRVEHSDDQWISTIANEEPVVWSKVSHR